MVSTGCGNISAKSKEDNGALSSSSIGKAFERQSLFSTTSLGKLLDGRNFAHFLIPLRVLI